MSGERTFTEERRTAETLINAIGLISVMIGAFLIMFYSFASKEVSMETRGALMGHSALMVGGIIMLLKIPMRPRVPIDRRFAGMERCYGALLTAIISVGLCFLLWGLYNMVFFGYSGKRMSCFMLGLIPLATVLMCNSRTVRYITTLWKITMSLAIGTMLIPFITDLSDIVRVSFLTLTMAGNLLCIWLIYIEEPYMEDYLRAREEKIAADRSLLRSNGLYIAVTLAVSVLCGAVIGVLSVERVFAAMELPAAIFGTDPELMLRLLVLAGCAVGGIVGWGLSYVKLRTGCFDSSKYIFTMLPAVVCEVLGVTAVFSLITCSRCFAAAMIGLAVISLAALALGLKVRNVPVQE